jgi:hypothetical protein
MDHSVVRQPVSRFGRQLSADRELRRPTSELQSQMSKAAGPHSGVIEPRSGFNWHRSSSSCSPISDNGMR